MVGEAKLLGQAPERTPERTPERRAEAALTFGHDPEQLLADEERTYWQSRAAGGHDSGPVRTSPPTPLARAQERLARLDTELTRDLSPSGRALLQTERRAVVARLEAREPSRGQGMGL